MAAVTTFKGHPVQDPHLVQILFNDPRAAWIWLPLRLWLGYQWRVEAHCQSLPMPRCTKSGILPGQGRGKRSKASG